MFDFLFCFLGINAAIVRGICKVIGTTLTKYKDPVSQNLVKNLIVSLIQHHPDLTFEHLNGVFKGFLAKDLASPSLKTSQAAVIALGWSLLLASNVKPTSETGKVEFPKLIEYQANLYQIAVSSANNKVSDKASQMLSHYWQQNDDLISLYFERLLITEASSSVILLLSHILTYKATSNNVEWLTNNKEKLLDHFIKGLVTVKVKPHATFIPSCSVLLKSITHDEFKTFLLSPLQRSMLRSPEIVLQVVGAIVHELGIDVSDFAVDLGKPLIQNLYSKDNTARAEAVESLKEVATKCSDAKSIEILLKQIFAVFNGSDGKITVAEYRINVLQVIYS